MSDNYSALVTKALAAKSKDKDNVIAQCEVCGNDNWEVQTYSGSLPALEGGAEAKRFPYIDHAFPMAMLVCSNCGFTMMFNLFPLGVADQLSIPKYGQISAPPPYVPTYSWWDRFKCWLGFGHIPDGPERPGNAGGRHCLVCNRVECVSTYDGRTWHKHLHQSCEERNADK